MHVNRKSVFHVSAIKIFIIFRSHSFKMNSTTTQSSTPQPGLVKLIQIVQRRHPGLDTRGAFKAIRNVKEKNGGVLKGLKFSTFHKILEIVVSDMVELDALGEKKVKQKQNKLGKSCPVCYRNMSKSQAVERHMATHDKNGPPEIEVELTEPDDDYYNFENLDEKQAGGTVEPEKAISSKKWKCAVCGKEFKHKVSLERHTKYNHGSSSEGISCDMCDLIFTRTDNLYVHKRKIHNAYHMNLDAIRISNETSISCEMCSKHFDKPEQFEAHIAMKICQDKQNCFDINDKEKYQCHLCERSYAHKKNLVAHLNWKHWEKSKFKCEVCNVTFTQKFSLVRHMKKAHATN